MTSGNLIHIDHAHGMDGWARSVMMPLCGAGLPFFGALMWEDLAGDAEIPANICEACVLIRMQLISEGWSPDIRDPPNPDGPIVI